MLKSIKNRKRLPKWSRVLVWLPLSFYVSTAVLDTIIILPSQAQSSPQTPLPPASPSQLKTPLANPQEGFVLLDNTPVKLRFKETITSKTAQENQLIDFEVAEDVVLKGVTVIARGSSAKGIIAEVKKARMLGRKGKLSIVLKEVPLVSGERVTLRANPTQGGGLSAGTIALSAVVTPFFLLMGGKEAKYTAGTEFSAFVDGDYLLDPSKFGGSSTMTPQPAPKKLF